jgi:hypothetical protein
VSLHGQSRPVRINIFFSSIYSFLTHPASVNHHILYKKNKKLPHQFWRNSLTRNTFFLGPNMSYMYVLRYTEKRSLVCNYYFSHLGVWISLKQLSAIQEYASAMNSVHGTNFSFQAYHDLLGFIMVLNDAVRGKKLSQSPIESVSEVSILFHKCCCKSFVGRWMVANFHIVRSKKSPTSWTKSWSKLVLVISTIICALHIEIGIKLQNKLLRNCTK